MAWNCIHGAVWLSGYVIDKYFVHDGVNGGASGLNFAGYTQQSYSVVCSYVGRAIPMNFVNRMRWALEKWSNVFRLAYVI
jgi:hypothetical protein